jgi:PhoH-like ATPase
VLHALRKAEIPLVCLTGLAGSGKTFLALMSGIDEMMSGKYERIIVTRNIEPVGRDIGFLPGDIKEKMSPWLSPLMDNFRHHFKDKTYFEMMMDKGQIEIAPLSYIRGRTFSNAYLIVDEAQNATIHELKTVITRIGENSKIVLMGDTDQIDTPYIDKRSNGLSIVIDKFAGSNMMAHVHLTRGERSALATYASRIL